MKSDDETDKIPIVTLCNSPLYDPMALDSSLTKRKKYDLFIDAAIKWTAVPCGTLKIRFTPKRPGDHFIANELDLAKAMRRKRRLQAPVLSNHVFTFAKDQRISGIRPKLCAHELKLKCTSIRHLSSLPKAQVDQHIKNLKYEARTRRFRRFSLILSKLMDHPRNRRGMFNVPVDPVALGIPTYTLVIKNPMDLGQIKERIDQAEYTSAQDFAADVRLVFENAMKFNPRGHYIHFDAQTLLGIFNEQFIAAHERFDYQTIRDYNHSCQVCCGMTCSLCDQKCLEFQFPQLSCSGNCGVPIRRGIVCHATRDGTRVWCSKCFNKSVRTKRTDTFRVDNEPSLHHVKEKLIKKRCEVDVEPWVKCDVCQRWMHQVCALFNAAQDDGYFACPTCCTKIESNVVKTAQNLPNCSLSEFLERHLVEKVGLEVAETLTVRVVSCTERNQVIPESIRHEFGYPKSLDYISKAVYIFQQQDGVDVCLFGLYVQEYDETCPIISNRRSVYIAYLDSVQYMKPAHVRTKVYHQLLIGYFDYARKCGFETVHIWSCPPQRRVSYVFWCHPPHQRTPGPEHLRKWYQTMLEKAKGEGIVSKWTTFYQRYFSTPKSLVAPCFDGDFWPTEAERLVGRKLKTKVYEASCTSVKAMDKDLLVVDLATPERARVDRNSKVPSSRFAATRNAFHQLCAQSQYQFDSLRRAKHSTMMMLHHIFNAKLNEVQMFCDGCNLLITSLTFWTCETCTAKEDFALCDWCHEAKRVQHVHPLVFSERKQIV